ncbi:MAG: LacI family DNA-binding transcriptional regulator [Parafilimonas sp.]|nr:LacI family DNA-binding transcriptional regulator [Parafilimonas sp.]
MQKPATILSIATELNITAATVSRALQNHPSISHSTKQSVLKVANKLNYKRNRIASSLRSGKTHMIGVIIPSANTNFFGSVVHGIEKCANEKGYNVLLYQSNETHEHEIKGIETFLAARVDGILVSVAKNTADFAYYEELKTKKIPIVFFDRAEDSAGISSVVIDDYKGAFIATEHLIKNDYKRIAHASGPQHLKIFCDRKRGYEDALKKHDMPLNDLFIYEGNVSIESGKTAIQYFLSLNNKPDAVFAAEDFTALGVMKELKAHNIKIPEEFGVFGFANELFGEHITPTLSTIDQQTVAMGKESFELLLQIIENKTETPVEKKIVLKPVPVFRESSQRKNIK